jgi:hypothetical protein
MATRLAVMLVATLLLDVSSLRSARPDSRARPESRDVAKSVPAPAPQATDPDPRTKANGPLIAKVLDRIRGREKEPASRVFQNIQLPWLEDVEAETLVSIMDVGYSRALGVACTHCHDELDLSSDAKRPKRAAREMARMHKMINEQLAAMKELEPDPDDRSINCMVCHRGRLDPRTGD